MQTVDLIKDYVFEIPKFFSEQECDTMIAQAEALGFSNATIETRAGPILNDGVRNNERAKIDDEELAASLWARLTSVMPTIFKGRTALGLNERIRYYRYDAGQRFNWHRDGFVNLEGGRRSQFTFMVYLNDDYEGGGTSFRGQKFPTFVTKPKKGQALLFYHPIWHRGDAVTAGRKYVLRSDVMYGPPDAE